jgi:hypothetical protein
MQIAPQSYWPRAALCAALFLPFALAVRIAAAGNGSPDSNPEPM